MRFIAGFCGIVLLFALSARAQVNQPSSLLLAASDLGGRVATPAASGPPSFPSMMDAAADQAAQSEPTESAYQAYDNYKWQLYAGYTFVRVYEFPKIPQAPNGLTFNSNGINVSAICYFGSILWLGLEGDALGTFASVPSSKFALAGGGVRARWEATHSFELWVHGTANVAYVSPQTQFGNQTSVGYQVGGGVDLFPHFHHFGLRAEGDLVGTHFFGTYQRSPQISAGLVYRF